MTLFQILHKDTSAALYEKQVEDYDKMMAIEQAVFDNVDLSYANLPNLNLRHANLSGGKLSHANFTGAQLGEANLNGADLSFANFETASMYGVKIAGANFHGANFDRCDIYRTSGIALPLNPELVIPLLDQVRSIVLKDVNRLNMDWWHRDIDWLSVAAADMTLCSTTHCLAGWMQALQADSVLRNMDPETAGTLLAPAARAFFYVNERTVIDWLTDRKYVEESSLHLESPNV